GGALRAAGRGPTKGRWFFFFSSRRRHTRWPRDWSSDVCSSDLIELRVTLSPTPLRELRPDVTTRIVPEPNAGRVPGCVPTSFGSNGQRHYGIQERHLKTKSTVLVSPAPTVIFCVAVPSFSCQASMR